jgi:hypothetical protein
MPRLVSFFPPRCASLFHPHLAALLFNLHQSCPTVPCHPSSHRLPQRRFLFSAPLVAIRERPAVDLSHPQASALTGPKPTPSTFCREHFNPTSRFRSPSGPDVAATSFTSSACTMSTHHPRRRPPRGTPHWCPDFTDAHHIGPPPLLHALDAAAPPSHAAPRRESGRPPPPLPWRHG